MSEEESASTTCSSWYPISIPNSSLDVSRPDPIIPCGIEATQEFISDDEVHQLVEIFDRNNNLWTCKGFAKRTREQHYSITDSSTTCNEFQWLIDRLMQKLSKTAESTGINYEVPNELIVEERFPAAYIQGERGGRLSYNAFETGPMKESKCCSCLEQYNQEKCACYVAQINLLDKCEQHLDKPKKREMDCWDIESTRHKYNFLMQPKALLVKTGECLWNWRSRIEAFPSSSRSNKIDDNESPERVITIKFRRSFEIHATKQVQTEEEKEEQDGGFRLENMTYQKPLEELLTIIVTTSPIKSNPSTEVLEKTFETFHHGGEAFLKCPKIIVCDGCRVISDDDSSKGSTSNKDDTRRIKVTKKYANAKQALRNGIATNDQAENYAQFKIALTKICEDAYEDELSPFNHTRVVELAERVGYGFALRHALYQEISTPYVCVIQHDRTFMRCTPMQEVVNSMVNNRSGDIKYVGINMRSNLTYRDVFNSKYGKDATAQLLDMVLHPPELALDANIYGPEGSSIRNMESGRLKKNLDSLAQSYKANIQYRSHAAMNLNPEEGKYHLSLTPTLFWYDNTHIVETAHYRDFIFNPTYRMVARGGFVEDKVSPLIIRNVERLGLKAGHSKFKCYILDDHSGYFFTGHLDGGSFMSESEKRKLKSRTEVTTLK